MAVPELPQHVLDTRYLKELGKRIFPRQGSTSSNSEEEEETAIELVGRDLCNAAWSRLCACDPDGRPKEEGFDEDSDREDGWYCSFRDIDPECKMHVVLDQARLDINAKSSEFPKDIQEEVSERLLLEYDKDVQKQQRRQTSAPLSPQFLPNSFQRLPPEILFEIILLAQVSDPHAHLTLSQVDGSLRALVNSTPRLWSRVDFLYPLPVVHTYLERSADTLLTVTALPPLHIGTAHHPLLEEVKRDEYNKMMQFFRALRPHRHRILSLCLRSDDLLFDLPDESDGQSIPDDFLGDGSMVNLEILDLELCMWSWMGLEDIPPSDSIRELRLRGPWTTDYMPFFSTHLKFLVIANNITPLPKVLDALQATPCLTSLTFLDMAFSGTRAKEGSVLPFEQLESLSLIRVFGSAAEALGECIVAPNLVSFTFQHASILHQVQDRKDINELRFFPAPQPSVRRLDLTGCNARPSFFNSVFRTFPCITHLRIASSNLTDDHLVGAVVKPAEDGEPGLTTLPDLKHLTIDNEFDTSLIGALSQIAYSRHSWGRRMESMTLRGIPVDSAAARDDLESIAGLVSHLEVGGIDQDLDVYGDSDDSASETSSEGEWASGDDEVLAAYQKVRRFQIVFRRLRTLEYLTWNVKYSVPSGRSTPNEGAQNGG